MTMPMMPTPPPQGPSPRQGAPPMMPPPGAPPRAAPDAGVGRYARPVQVGPEEAAVRAHSDALASGAGDPFLAAKEAWKTATVEAADPNTPDEPGSENLRTIQAHLQKKKRVDPLTAYALARVMLPQLGGSSNGS